MTKYIDGLVETVYWHAGRSPAYGEGVTFWALGEMVRGRTGLVEGDDEATTRAAVADGGRAMRSPTRPSALDRAALLVLLGLEGSAGGGREELFGAWRTFFERIAASGPVVLVFEDLHWADAACSTSSTTCSTGARACRSDVVTLARPELLERRPGWGAGKRTFIALALEPLPDDAMRELLAARAGAAGRRPGDDRRPRRRHPAVRGRDRPDARRRRPPRLERRRYRPIGDLGDLAVPGRSRR